MANGDEIMEVDEEEDEVIEGLKELGFKEYNCTSTKCENRRYLVKGTLHGIRGTSPPLCPTCAGYSGES